MDNIIVQVDLKVYQSIADFELPITLPEKMLKRGHLQPGYYNPVFSKKQYEDFSTWADGKSELKILGIHTDNPDLL